MGSRVSIPKVLNDLPMKEKNNNRNFLFSPAFYFTTSRQISQPIISLKQKRNYI